MLRRLFAVPGGYGVTVFREGEAPPTWCELEAFRIIRMIPDAISDERRVAPRERILVTLGAVQVRQGARSMVLRDGQFADVVGDAWEVRAGSRAAEFVRLSGRWGEELGGCGIFRAVNEDHPVNAGDPVAYGKTTSVDSHYHDCDEYWIVLEGAGTVVVGERHIGVQPGDCVPIGTGHHHDLPLVDTPVKAVYFETTLEGRKRIGHLWNHTHGPAAPRLERT